MFRTLLVHHQEQLYKLYIAFGICRYVWLLRGYSHTTARPPNSFYTFTVLCLRTWENVLMICFFIEPSKLFYQYYTVRATCKNNEKEVERSWLVSALWSSDARRRKCDALFLFHRTLQIDFGAYGAQNFASKGWSALILVYNVSTLINLSKMFKIFVPRVHVRKTSACLSVTDSGDLSIQKSELLKYVQRETWERILGTR